MPENNLMQSVLEDAVAGKPTATLYHTDDPNMNAEITNERIAEEMERWLEVEASNRIGRAEMVA